MEGIIALFIPIAICVVLPVLVVWIVYRSRTHVMDKKMEVIIKAIENGQEIDPGLLTDAKESNSLKYRLLGKFQCGTICTLLGAGILAVSFVSADDPDTAIWILTGAIILLGIGIGYLAAFFLGRRFLANEMEAEENAAAAKAE